MAEKLRELRECRRDQAALHVKMLAYLDQKETEKVWCQETDNTWSEMNGDFNALKLEEQKILASRTADAKKQMKRDQRREVFGDDNPLAEMSDIAIANLAMRHYVGWEESETSSAAFKACNLNVRNKQLVIGLTSDFAKIQRAYNSAGSPSARHGEILNSLTNNASPGSLTFGPTFQASLEENLLHYGGMMQLGELIRTSSGETFTWPTTDDTGNKGRLIAEGNGGGVVTEVNPSFGQFSLGAYKYTSDKILVDYEFFEDSTINAAELFGRQIGERLGRAYNEAWTVGTGVAQPTGVVTATTTTVPAATLSAITFDEFIDLEHAVDPAYRSMPGVGYMLSDATLKVARKLKDADGRYLWQQSANSGAPDTLNMRSYWINQDMPGIAASTKSVLFGRFPAYKMRMVNNMRFYRLQERYRENDQDAFLAFGRIDGNLKEAGTAQMVALEHPAT